METKTWRELKHHPVAVGYTLLFPAPSSSVGTSVQPAAASLELLSDKPLNTHIEPTPTISFSALDYPALARGFVGASVDDGGG